MPQKQLKWLKLQIFDRTWSTSLKFVNRSSYRAAILTLVLNNNVCVLKYPNYETTKYKIRIFYFFRDILVI